MKYRVLGKTGLPVSEIGFGGWAIGGPARWGRIPVGWSGVSDVASRRALAEALDRGINFFDTAGIYGFGHSEALIGQAIKGRRTQVILATKGGSVVPAPGGAHKDFSRQHLHAAVDDSLQRLQTDWIDLYQLHNPPPEEIARAEAFDTLEELRRLGKIRFYGVSISRPEEGLELIQRGHGHVLQVLYNILNQAPAQALFPLARAHGVGVIARVPLASGLLTGKISATTVFDEDDNRRNYLTARRLPGLLQQVEALRRIIEPYGIAMVHAALRFVLADEAVSVALAGAKDPAQVSENAAASGEPLPAALAAELRRRWRAYDFYLRHRIAI